MCADLDRFCRTREEYYPISVDPTFDFGPFEVTPFTYRQLLLRSNRSDVHPVFLGPTAIHHSKDSQTYGKIVSSVSRACPQLKTSLSGFITDGELALSNALEEGFPHTTSLRCFRHVHSSCKHKLEEIGISPRKTSSFFFNFVLGSEGLVECEKNSDLSAMLEDGKSSSVNMRGKSLACHQDTRQSFGSTLRIEKDLS